MLQRTIVLASVIVLLLSLFGSVAEARSPVALGLSVEPAESRDMGAVDRATKATRAKPALWSLWSAWGSRGGQESCTPNKGTCAFPTQAAAGLQARGITPLIWWVPTGPNDAQLGKYSRYLRIIRGRHDDYIRRWARDAKAHGGPIVLRFAHEPNGQWYPWGLARQDNSPRRFKKAWRHVWWVFRDVGATNVRFLWNPIEEGCAGCRPNFRFESFYPGHKYVDYVGMNAYNWGSRWKPLHRLLRRPVRRLGQVTATRSQPRGKPIILGEVASDHRAGNKARWLKTGYDEIFRRWPKVKAIVYLDVDMRPAGHPDWRLVKPANGSALRAYAYLAGRPRFRGAIR